MTIDRWGSMVGSSAPRPQVAPGTPCSPCTAKGHFCPAYEIVDGRAVCLNCLDGVDCPKVPRNGVVDAPKPTAVLSSARRLGKREPASRVPPLYKGKVQARERARAMLASGMSLKATMAATGLAKSTVSNVRATLPGLPRVKSDRPPPKATELSAAEAERVVDEAREITAQVEDEVRARSNGAFVMLEKECAVFPAAVQPIVQPDVQPDATLAARVDAVPATEYAVVDVCTVPGRKPPSTYDYAVEKLKLLPMGKALMRCFANAAIAETYRDGICKRARQAGLVVSSKQDGAVIYVWRRAE